MSKETDFQLLETLAAMNGEYVEVRDGCIILNNDCPTYGGTYFADSEEGLTEAINTLTYDVLCPLAD